MIRGHKRYHPLCIVLGVFCVVCLLTAVDQSALASPTLNLDQPTYFLSPDAEPFMVEPGTYQVEAAEAWLKLIPEAGSRTEAVLIQAIPGMHDNEVTTAEVVMTPIEDYPDLSHLALVLPDGRELGAVGSTSGIWPRSGWTFHRPTVPGGAGVNNPVPSGQFTKPNHGATVRGRVLIDVAASATRGVAHVQINIDNNPNICSLERRAPYTCTWDTTKVADGQHRLSAVITDTQNGKRLAAVTVTVHNNLTKRPPGSSEPRVNIPLDCRPFATGIGKQRGRHAPALAVYRNKLHLVVSDELVIPGHLDEGIQTLDINLNTLQHYTMSKHGRWSKPITIKGQKSEAGVALAVYKGQLHKVHRGATNRNLYHSIYNGREWTRNVRIPAQSLKAPRIEARPALAVSGGRLHLVYPRWYLGFPKGHMYNLNHSFYINGRWSERKRTEISPRIESPIALQLIGQGRLDVVYGTYVNRRLNSRRFSEGSGDWSNSVGLGRMASVKIKGGPTLLADTQDNVYLLYRPKSSGERIYITKRLRDGVWTSSKRVEQVNTKSDVGAAIFQGCLHTVHVDASSTRLIHTTLPLNYPTTGQ